jgi:NADH-quinone oxidoreductase E subunit
VSETFAFNAEYEARAQTIIGRYPEGRQQSAVIPLLDLAQRQAGGWLPTHVIEYVASYLEMPKIRVLEVDSFYSMFNLEPVGEHFIQLCRTTPCWLRGSDDLRAAAKEVTGCGLGETSEDGKFTVVEVECLGACCNAPMVQINDDYYEDLTAENFKSVLEALKRGEKPEPGSAVGRNGSEPEGGLTTLTTEGA